MKILKYSTEHLICVREFDQKHQEHYQIFEKENEVKPIAIYIDKSHMKLADEFPIPERTYKYFKEMCEIVSVLVKEEAQNLKNGLEK